jgi:hypothetical protein
LAISVSEALTHFDALLPVVPAVRCTLTNDSHSKSGNKDFCTAVTLWTVGARGVLKVWCWVVLLLLLLLDDGEGGHCYMPHVMCHL